MPEQKMKITDDAFSDYTGYMFRTGFTHSVSDTPLSERLQSRLAACFKAEPFNDGDEQVSVDSVTVTPKESTVKVGETVTLTGTVSPANATNKNVTWVSKNPDIATVDSAGVVKGVSAGLATIEMIAEDGGAKDSATVEVTAPEDSIDQN